MEPDVNTFNSLIEALASHHWPFAVGFGIVFLVYGANRFGLKDKVGAKYVPWVAAGLGIVSAIGAQLATGIGWEEAVGKGLMAGASATGLWELVMKHVLPASTPPASTPPTPPAA